MNQNGKRSYSMDCRKTISFLSLWAGLLLIISFILGIKWFERGDMGWREVMYYHGLMICAWTLLLLACLRYVLINSFLPKWPQALCLVCVAAAVFAGIGGSLITEEGLSLGRILQIIGMMLADLAGLIIIILLIELAIIGSADLNKFALWSVAIIAAAISLATPLGHLAGAIKDIGDKLPMLGAHAKMIGAEQDAAVDGYIGSHSHQIVAAFLVCACILPLASIRKAASGWATKLMFLGIGVTLIATIGQMSLYQYSAWFGWEPPTLFESGPNGMPFDDLLLSIVAVGPLFAIPAIWLNKGAGEQTPFLRAQNRLIYLAFSSYVVAMVVLGIYIEFHEGFFGGAQVESGAAGVTNDLSYIRGHLLFGCMILPLLLGLLLNLRKPCRVTIALALAVIIIGTAGVFSWTFTLNPILAKISLGLCGLFLISGAVDCWKQRESTVYENEQEVVELSEQYK
jgi:hypothetical protein